MTFKIDIAIVLFFICLFSSCGNDDTAVFNNAEWISDERPLPENDSLFYLDNPAPVFRKEFIVEKDIKSARLFITAAGYYRFSLNGVSSEENVLSPAWTDYSKRIYFSVYDISHKLVKGTNCMGVMLGNGFYNPLPLRMWGHLNLREELTVGKPCFIARLSIEYSDGTEQEIVSDESWKYAYGPVRRNDVYLGVVYDGSYEKPGWKNPGFDDEGWMNAVVSPGPGGETVERFFPPVVIVDTINPDNLVALEGDTFIVDMGVNFTGTYLVRMAGKAGDTVNFRFGERVYESGELNPMTSVCGQIKSKGVGGPGAPAIAWQTDTYIFDKDTSVHFSPCFTYHTYRYMEITGLGYRPPLCDISGLFFSTDLQSNDFTCSSDIINSIQKASVRTFRSNLISIQSDCPAREKFAYGGDLNATSEAFIYNFNMKDFYRKTIYDWIDAINDSIFIDTAPRVGVNYCGISWESAFLITQYYLYLYYDDRDIVRDLYEFDKRWMEKAERLHPEGIVNEGLSDHESLKQVPVELTGTAHYLQCARIMKEFAGIMNDSEGLEKYSLLESELSELIVNNFWSERLYEVENKQTLYATLLFFDLLAVEERERAVDSLVSAIYDDGGITTGIFGTKYILSALSENGEISLAYDLVNNTDYPGWGYMISRGATTIWETWKESDNVFSNCHPMFGSVSEWFYKHLAGIIPDPAAPGFVNILLRPKFPDGLDSVNCSYDSESGLIVSNWKREPDNNYIYRISIPDGSCAKVEFTHQSIHVVRIKDITTGNYIKTEKVKDLQSYPLPGGEYELLLEIYNNTY